MSRLLYRQGHRCARHRRIVVVAWLVAVVLIALVARSVGSQTSDNLTLPGTGSTTATDLLQDKLPKQANGTNPLTLHSTSGRLDQGANAKAVQATVRSLERQDDVESAVSPLSSEGSDQLSKDGRIGYIAVALKESPGELDEDEANAVIDAAEPAVKAGIQVAAGGYLGKEVSKPSTHASEAIGLTAAVIILLFTFGTAVAMSIPIVTALLGLVSGLSLIGLLGHVIDVPSVAPTLGTMLGLGVGIDYALFIVTRYREGLRAGYEPDEAVARSCASSGSAVMFAGTTVVIALLSLVFAGIPIVSALGYSAAIMVTIAIIAALTLLPALLSLLGTRIESLRVPLGRSERRESHEGWVRWAHWIADHRWTALIVAVLILLALAIPVRDMHLGQQDVGQLPESTTARQSYDLLTTGFGPGENGPLLVAVKFEKPAHNDQKQLDQLEQQQKRQQQQAQQAAQQQAAAETQQLIDEGVPPDEAQQQAEADAQQAETAQEPSARQQHKADEQEAFLKSSASDPRLVRLQKKIGNTADVKSVSGAKVDSTNRAAVFTVTAKTAPSASATQRLIRDLRDHVIPDATEGEGLTAYVGGTTAGYIDLADRISDKLPSVIAIVVFLSFLLLLIAFRSIVVPLTAGLMNLLSVAAAYGVLTLVFQKGFGTSVIGLDQLGPDRQLRAAAHVRDPVRALDGLRGLPADPHPRALGGDRATTAPRSSTASPQGRLITSAALIMVSVFCELHPVNGDPTVKQFGVGLAVAVAIDATVVRCLLVPAVMEICGKANWWLPPRLDRALPQLGIESEEGLPEPP